MSELRAEQIPPTRLDHEFFGNDARPYLGAVLLKSKLLRPGQLDEALAEQREQHRRLGEILVERGWLFPEDIARALAAQHGLDLSTSDTRRSTVWPPRRSIRRSGSAIARFLFGSYPMGACSSPLQIRTARDWRRSGRLSRYKSYSLWRNVRTSNRLGGQFSAVFGHERPGNGSDRGCTETCEGSLVDYLHRLGCSVEAREDGLLRVFVTFSEMVALSLREWCASWSQGGRAAMVVEGTAVA